MPPLAWTEIKVEEKNYCVVKGASFLSQMRPSDRKRKYFVSCSKSGFNEEVGISFAKKKISHNFLIEKKS